MINRINVKDITKLVKLTVALAVEYWHKYRFEWDRQQRFWFNVVIVQCMIITSLLVAIYLKNR